MASEVWFGQPNPYLEHFRAARVPRAEGLLECAQEGRVVGDVELRPQVAAAEDVGELGAGLVVHRVHAVGEERVRRIQSSIHIRRALGDALEAVAGLVEGRRSARAIGLDESQVRVDGRVSKICI